MQQGMINEVRSLVAFSDLLDIVVIIMRKNSPKGLQLAEILENNKKIGIGVSKRVWALQQAATQKNF